MDKIEEIAKACQIKEGWFPPSNIYKDGSVSYFCKNPGNILYGDLAKSLGATGSYHSPNGLTYAMFNTYEDGFYALKVFLMLGFSGQLKSYSPDMTLAEFFKVYSGGGATYGQFVADKTGFPVTTKVKYLYDDEWDKNHPETVKFYSQKDYQDKLGTGNSTIAQAGCYITSFCNLHLVDIDPETLNQICIKNGLYDVGSLKSQALADYYGLKYSKTTAVPAGVCIAETDRFAKVGFPQHFFVYNPETKERVDPLDANPDWEINDYRIVSFRVFNF